MLDMIDAMNTDVMNTTEPLAADLSPETMDSQKELGEAITSLWSAHLNAKNAARATKEELRTIRAELGEQLHKLKQVLAQPGRGGQWSGFLREHKIPRATGDRLVERHLRSLNPNVNCVTEQISEPTEEDVQKLFNAVWPQLQSTLRSRESLGVFIDLLKSKFESSEIGEQAIAVLASSATCPASDEDYFDEHEVNAAPFVARADEQVI